jgi:hypothetical protein
MSAAPNTLIFLGKGATADTLPEYFAAYPEAELWTLNQATHPRSRLHFDVHYDRRFWPLLDELPAGRGDDGAPVDGGVEDLAERVFVRACLAQLLDEVVELEHGCLLRTGYHGRLASTADYP